MASRKFKESWVPSPLHTEEEKRPAQPPPEPTPRTPFRRALVIIRFSVVWLLRELVRSENLQAKPEQVRALVSETAQTYEQP